MSCWVVDTSPLIFLASLDRLDLLETGAEEVFAPPAVLAEIRAREDRAAQEVDAASRSWLRSAAPVDRSAVEVLLQDLDAGEAEVIALAREVVADRVVMDDLAGRRYARRLGLPLVGTLGLLLAARLRGEISSLADEIERLQQAGFYASKALVTAVLRAAGE